MKNLLACYANCRYNTHCEELKSELLDKTEQATGDINAYLTERGRTPIAIQYLKRGMKFTDVSNTERSSATAGEKKTVEGKKHSSKRKRARKAPAPKKLLNSKSASAKPLRHTVKLSKVRSASYLGSSRSLKTKNTVIDAQPSPSILSLGDKNQPVKRKAESNAPAAGRKRKAGGKRKVVMPKKTNRPSVLSARNNEQPSGAMTSLQPAAEAGAKASMATRRKTKNNSSKRQAGRSNGKLYIILEGKSASLVDEQELMRHLFANASTGARYFEAKEVEARVQIVHK
jgi:hypothetical protein